jgi:histidinol phosphatase-like enzyme
LHCPWLEHEDRKPNPGLFLKAEAKWGIDMAASLFLGDKERDVQAGKNAGVGRNYLLSDGGGSALATAVVANPQEMIPFLTE